MVRYYILPNADHLIDDELKFEFDLRGIEVDDNAKIEEIRRDLRHAYKADRREPKTYKSGANIVKEMQEVEPIVRTLRQQLREKFDYVVVSRFRHYLIRLASAEASNEDEKNMKEDCCKQIEEILRAYRQRVTYDPEQSNDETDLDLGDGAKALKESWRNPDPNATVKTGKEVKKNTGTKPKEKEKKENKSVETDKQSKENKEGGTKKDSQSKIDKYTPQKDRHSKEIHKKHYSHSDKHGQHSRDKTKKYREHRSSSYYSTTDFSESSDTYNSDDKHSTHRTRSHNKSRGSFSSRSASTTDSEQEERTANRSRNERHYRRRREEYYRSARSRVENWDIVFSGDARSIQVEDFLNKVKKLAKHERVSKRELLDRIHYKLKGEASDWWFTREDHCTTWEKFESEIRFRFGNPNRDRGIRSQLRELRQKRGETFVAFVTEVEKLNQCLKHPHSSRTIFEIVWEGMRPHYRSKLATTRVRNLEHLLDLNHRIDANDLSLYRTGQNTRNEVHNLDAQSYSENENSSSDEYAVNTLQRKTKTGRETQKAVPVTNAPRSQTVDESAVKCWNCQKVGHHWRTCKETKLIFCYACGNLGRTTRTCERNHPQSTPQTNTNNSSNSQRQSLN